MFDSQPVAPRTPAVGTAIRRYWVLASAVFAVCVLAAVAVTLLSPPKPVATAKLTLDDPRGNSVFRQNNLPPADLSTYTAGRASFAASEPVLTRASQLLAGSKSELYLSKHVTASIGAQSDILKIRAKGDSVGQAVTIANAVATAYQDLSAQQTSDAAAAALTSISDSRVAAIRAAAGDTTGKTAAGRSLSTTLAALDSSASDIRLNAVLFNDGVSYNEPADKSQTSLSGSAVKNIAASILVGLLFAVAAAVAMASRRRPVEAPEDVYGILSAPLLGELNASYTNGRKAAQYDVIASAVAAVVPQGTIAVIDCGTRPRPAGVTSLIARAVANTGISTGLLNASGRVEESFADANVDVSVADPGRLGEVSSELAKLRSRCDVVFMVCPSLDERGSAPLLKSSDTVIVVVPMGERGAHLTRIRHTLSLLDSPVLGFVFARGQIRLSVPMPSGPPLATNRL